MAVTAYNFLSSIAINTHMAYTDGAYAKVANVASDLAYLGVTTIRDSIPNPNGGVPAANQIAALQTLASEGINFDLLTSSSLTVAQTTKAIVAVIQSSPDSVIAVEGPNEINNNPVSYGGLTGQAAAVVYQTALYAAIKGTLATSNIAVYDFTGGLSAPSTVAGSMTRNSDGSYVLGNGQTGFPVTLPPGLSTIIVTYTGSGTAESGLFAAPGQGQVSSIVYGTNGVISYTYDNKSGSAQALYVDFADWGSTLDLTGVAVTGAGSSVNLVTFDPNLSLAGQADYANIHPYAYGNSATAPLITSNYQAAYGAATPGPRVITEAGYTTDPNAPNGVSQIVQAQQIINGLFDAYQSGVAKTYIYELLDEKSDPSNTNSQMHYGLFNADNTPKLAATALHNLTAILADTGSKATSFQTGLLNYTETGAAASDNAMLLEKSGLVFDIAIWNDAAAGSAAFDPVMISLGQSYQKVTVYDTVTDVSTVYQNISQVHVNLGADAMIVEVDPDQASALAGRAAITTSILNQIGHMSFLTASHPAAANSGSAGLAGDATILANLFPSVLPEAVGASVFSKIVHGSLGAVLTGSAPGNQMALIASLLAKFKL
jgi:hypothetical protein